MNREEVEQIVKEVLEDSKELKCLEDLLKRRRRYTKLRGHTKIPGERLCECGLELESNHYKSGGWVCPKEEKEWDFVFEKLKIRG